MSQAPAASEVTHKPCSRCKAVKTLGEFGKSRSKPDGLTPECRDCRHEYRVRRRSTLTPSTPPVKTCARCRQTKAASAFNANRENRDGLGAYCRSCQSEYMRARTYGLQDGDYAALLEAQGGKCAICRREGAVMHVDHCHADGAVRGLLCKNCNTGLGHFGDDIERLESALAYLRRHT